MTSDEEAVRAPSLLPGWTRGHLLTPLARNVDGLVNLIRAARTGEPRAMYAGGREQRDADIDAGGDDDLGGIGIRLGDPAAAGA